MIDFDAEGSGKQAQLVLTLSSLLKIQQTFVVHWHNPITVGPSIQLFITVEYCTCIFKFIPNTCRNRVVSFCIKINFSPSDRLFFLFDMFMLTYLQTPPPPPLPAYKKQRSSDWIVYHLCFLLAIVVSDNST